VGLCPLGTAATSGLLYKPQMIDEGDCGAIGGMKTGRGNRSTRRKPAPAPLCPQISHDQTRARTRAAAVGSQRLTDGDTILNSYGLYLLTFQTFAFPKPSIYALLHLPTTLLPIRQPTIFIFTLFVSMAFSVSI
jgi:hypothetical protein